MKRKLLIIGHGRHGKDTVAEMLRDHHGYTFASSSEYVGRKAIWPRIRGWWGKLLAPSGMKYNTFDECFADRGNHRDYWGNAISEYNTPDKTRTAAEMLHDGYDIYVGMRRYDELYAVEDAELFDAIIWVDRLEHLPPEPITSMNLNLGDATFYLDNNGSLLDLLVAVNLMVEQDFGIGDYEE